MLYRDIILTELAEEAAYYNLVQPPCSWMGIVRRRCPSGRDILQALHSAALLDVVREITTGTELDDKVNVFLCTLEKSEFWRKYGMRTLTTMSRRRVMCLCDKALRISISPWRLSKSFGLRPALLTVLIATCRCVCCRCIRQIKRGRR